MEALQPLQLLTGCGETEGGEDGHAACSQRLLHGCQLDGLDLAHQPQCWVVYLCHEHSACRHRKWGVGEKAVDNVGASCEPSAVCAMEAPRCLLLLVYSR